MVFTYSHAAPMVLKALFAYFSLHIPQGDTTRFTGTASSRNVGIIGTYLSGTSTLRDTVWVYIKPLMTFARSLGSPLVSSERLPVSSTNGAVRVHLPPNGMHVIRVYSLSGTLISSHLTSDRFSAFTMPKGAYIMTVETFGNKQVRITKIISR
jgi:hypothetical protein